jgi:hypothetical protein
MHPALVLPITFVLLAAMICLGIKRHKSKVLTEEHSEEQAHEK